MTVHALLLYLGIDRAIDRGTCRIAVDYFGGRYANVQTQCVAKLSLTTISFG